MPLIKVSTELLNLESWSVISSAFTEFYITHKSTGVPHYKWVRINAKWLGTSQDIEGTKPVLYKADEIGLLKIVDPSHNL